MDTCSCGKKKILGPNSCQANFAAFNWLTNVIHHFVRVLGITRHSILSEEQIFHLLAGKLFG